MILMKRARKSMSFFMDKSKRFLLDTQIFILWMKQDKRLKKEIVVFLKDPESIIFLSIASVWEMVIKKRIGKLRLPHDWKETLEDSRFEILPINLEQIFELENLPLYHHDPFDRMLIAQAIAEEAILITGDEKIWEYDIPILKA